MSKVLLFQIRAGNERMGRGGKFLNIVSLLSSKFSLFKRYTVFPSRKDLKGPAITGRNSDRVGVIGGSVRLFFFSSLRERQRY